MNFKEMYQAYTKAVESANMLVPKSIDRASKVVAVGYALSVLLRHKPNKVEKAATLAYTAAMLVNKPVLANALSFAIPLARLTNPAYKGIEILKPEVTLAQVGMAIGVYAYYMYVSPLDTVPVIETQQDSLIL